MTGTARLGRGVAALALVVGSAGVGAMASASVTAPAAAAGTCTAPSVALVVDFTHWSGGFQGNGSAGNRVSACVPFTSGMKGIDLFTRGGFTTAGTQHDGPAFLCRINGLPAATGNPSPRPSEPCTLTPPASAYWSYWYAKPGATTWTYSSYGAYGNTVTAGRVEAWTYGATDIGGTTGQPSFSPQSVMPAPAATSAPTAGSGGGAPAGNSGSGAVTGAGSAGGAGSASGGASSGTGAAGSRSSAPASTGATGSGSAVGAAGSASPGATGASGGPTTAGTGTGTPTDPRTVDIKDIARPAGVSSAGTPWATVGTIAVLAVAALVGGGLAWRRKRVSS